MADACRMKSSPSTPDLSGGIAIARVLCILGIVYVHAWTGLTGDRLMAQLQTGQSVLRWTLMELFGRSAVPLLGMISGWLVAPSAARRSYGAFFRGKARTILLPMVLWNALSIFLVSGAAYLGMLRAPVPSDIFSFLDELLCLVTPNNINVQAGFLRDLFLCMMIAPLLVRLPLRWLLLVCAGVILWIGMAIDQPLLLRPQILLFFISGIIFRRHGVANRVAALPFLPVLLLYLVPLPFKLWLDIWGSQTPLAQPATAALIELPIRFASAAFFWWSACWLARSRAAGMVKAVEPYAFFLFCSHLILLWLGGPLLGHITGPQGSRFYPVYLVLQPALILCATILLGNWLVKTAPDAARVLSGGRLAGADAARPKRGFVMSRNAIAGGSAPSASGR